MKDNPETSQTKKSIGNSNQISTVENSEYKIEPIETIQKNINSYLSNKNQGSNINYNEKTKKNYPIKNSNYFDNRYTNSYNHHSNSYGSHFGNQTLKNTHRTNTMSYYRSYQGIKKSSIELNRNNYAIKKKKMEEHPKINSPLKGKNHNQLFFIHAYDKCSDFSNYSSFQNLNLKFLKQNYKMKDPFEGEQNENNQNLNKNIGSPNLNNNQIWNMRMNKNPNQVNPLLYRMNVSTPSNSNSNMNNIQMQLMQKMMMNIQNNVQNNQMNLNNLGNNNILMNQVNQINKNFNNLILMNKAQNNPNNQNNSNLNIQQYLQLIQHLQQQIYIEFKKMNNTNNLNLNNFNNINNMAINNVNNPNNLNAINSINKHEIENINPNDINNSQNIQNILNLYPIESFNKPYAPILKLSPPKMMNQQINYNFQTYNLSPMNINSTIMNNNNINIMNNSENEPTQETIDENLKTGKYLTGTIRMNKCHTHGYITVKGLENDILIRGSKNLNQCLNLDEVIVELLPIEEWKPLVNKKRKISYVNEEPQIPIINSNEALTDIENEENSNKLINNNNNDSLSSNYKEKFDTKEERLKYINKVYDLRPEGKIVKILKSPNKEKEQIAKIEVFQNQLFAIPIDETIPRIQIKKRKRNEINKNGDLIYKNKYFLVKIIGWNTNSKCPKGTIQNEIGPCGNIDVESFVLLRQYNIEYNENFPNEVIEELNKKIENLKITEEFIKNSNRLDLRNDIIFTCDPYTSKDLDDAISVKLINEEEGLLEVGVHIADPSLYVEKNSLLDKQAIYRGTTVYLVQLNIPMLPKIISENICSLMPNKDSFAISCIFRINYKTGALDLNFKPKFDLSVINSKAKWNYDLVQDIIDGKDIKYENLNENDGTKPLTEEIFNEMVKSVHLLYQLTKLVRKQRFESGSLMINNDNIHFDLDEKNKPIGFKIEQKKDSHSLIEELMLIANKLCAEFIYDNMKQYALIRRHPYLNDNKFNEIQRYLISNKINVDYEEPQELNKLLLDLQKNNLNKFLCIQHKLKTFMLRAEYVIAGYFDFDELKHCALNFELYTHFTSPIRRYPDIIVHRQIKEILKMKKGEISNEEFKIFDEYSPLMEHFNDVYNNSKQISQKSQRIFQCIYLKTIPYKKYEALIMDINGKSNKRINVNEIIVALFIPEINLELEWKKEDNENIINIRFEKNDNELIIDYKTENGGIGNKTLKTFDSIKVDLIAQDSIPIDIKCIINLN